MHHGRLAVAVAVIGMACGGDPDGSSSIADDCASYCQKMPACGETPGADCQAACVTLASGYNPAYWDAFTACYVAATPCDNKTDDTCSGTAFTGLMRRPIDDEFRTQCLAMESRCSIVCHPGEPDLDACGFTVIYSQDALTSAEACLAGDCASVCSCLTSTLHY